MWIGNHLIISKHYIYVLETKNSIIHPSLDVINPLPLMAPCFRLKTGQPLGKRPAGAPPTPPGIFNNFPDFNRILRFRVEKNTQWNRWAEDEWTGISTFLGMILETFETHGRKQYSKFEIRWDPLWKTSYLQYQTFLEEWPSISIFPTRQRSSVALGILDQEMGSLRTLGLPRCNHRATAKYELPNSSNLECWKWHSKVTLFKVKVMKVTPFQWE